jgi:hypothetical protein
MFVIISPDGGHICVQSVERVEHAMRSCFPGRYDIDKVTVDPITSEQRSRHWGIGIKRRDGKLALIPDPWPE